MTRMITHMNESAFMSNEKLWIKCNECFIEEDVSREKAKDWQCSHCFKTPELICEWGGPLCAYIDGKKKNIADNLNEIERNK